MVIDRLASYDVSSITAAPSPDGYNNASSFDKIFAAHHQNEYMLQNNKSSLYADNLHALASPAEQNVSFNVYAHTDSISNEHGVAEANGKDTVDKQSTHSANSDTEAGDEDIIRPENAHLENHADVDATTHTHEGEQQQKANKQAIRTLLRDNKEARDVSMAEKPPITTDTSNTTDNTQGHQHLVGLDNTPVDVQKDNNAINQQHHSSRSGDQALSQEAGGITHTSTDRVVSVREITEHITTTQPSDKASHIHDAHKGEMSYEESSRRNSNTQDQHQARSGQDQVRISVIDRSAYDQHIEPKNNTLKVATFENKNTQEFKHFLDRDASSSIVKHARFVFHNNSHSEVRILLRPAELGTMKLKLFMQNDAIHGKIIVDNMFARDAVENGIVDIQRIIRGQGFQGGSIDVDINPHSHSAPHYKNHLFNASRIVLPSEDKEIYPVLKNNDAYANSLLINLYA